MNLLHIIDTQTINLSHIMIVFFIFFPIGFYAYFGWIFFILYSLGFMYFCKKDDFKKIKINININIKATWLIPLLSPFIFLFLSNFLTLPTIYFLWIFVLYKIFKIFFKGSVLKKIIFTTSILSYNFLFFIIISFSQSIVISELSTDGKISNKTSLYNNSYQLVMYSCFPPDSTYECMRYSSARIYRIYFKYFGYLIGNYPTANASFKKDATGYYLEGYSSIENKMIDKKYIILFNK